jgi:hypothetical protein
MATIVEDWPVDFVGYSLEVDKLLKVSLADRLWRRFV